MKNYMIQVWVTALMTTVLVSGNPVLAAKTAANPATTAAATAAVTKKIGPISEVLEARGSIVRTTLCEDPMVKKVLSRDDQQYGTAAAGAKGDRCQALIDKLITVFSDGGKCRWAESSTSVDCAEHILKETPAAFWPSRIPILWTGLKAKATALTGSLGTAEHKYISLEATVWGAMLDRLNRITYWENSSLHWAALSEAFVSKSPPSTQKAPVVVGISIPTIGYFATKELPRMRETPRNEYVLIDLYGKEVCEKEKESKIENLCRKNRWGHDQAWVDKCVSDVRAVDCEISCEAFTQQLLSQGGAGGAAATGCVGKTEPKGNWAAKGYDDKKATTFIMCRDKKRSAYVFAGVGDLGTNAQGTNDFPSAYFSDLLKTSNFSSWDYVMCNGRHIDARVSSSRRDSM